MVKFVLNESKLVNLPGDLSVFSSLDSVSLHIEPIDVENKEYFLFDTDGTFYEISTTGKFDYFIYRENFSNIELANHVIDEYLRAVNRYPSQEISLEKKAESI